MEEKLAETKEQLPQTIASKVMMGTVKSMATPMLEQSLSAETELKEGG